MPRWRFTGGRGSRCSAPATNWCRRAASSGPATSSIRTAMRYWRSPKRRAPKRWISASRATTSRTSPRRPRAPGSGTRMCWSPRVAPPWARAMQGLRLSFWRVALRPGRPMLYGRLGPMHALGVPGNPASSYVCAVLFLVPLIRRLAGWADGELGPRLEPARLGRDLPANDERADYLRATLVEDENGVVATPLPDQDSSLMLPLARADCLLIREPNAPAAAAGSPCVIVKLRL